ncbi:hypothetical protein PVAP13_3NG173900 [Panicum virgatum]|uniref:Uncharacterized protein n=1 Tax=Panicum virgatum TaxID=38727 RepID=A0A8T0UGZ4_PANVG|nr:hypothetical protein PVAP13_3NG173900 [Panicum virgatum]
MPSMWSGPSAAHKTDSADESSSVTKPIMAPSSTDRSDRHRGVIIPLFCSTALAPAAAAGCSPASPEGSRVRSAGLPCLASSPTRSFAAAEDQQAVERRGPREASVPPPPHPPRLLPPPAARRAARIPRPRSAAASPVGPAGPCSGRDFPRRFHAACAGRRCRVPWSRSGLVKCCPLGRRRGFPSAARPSS